MDLKVAVNHTHEYKVRRGEQQAEINGDPYEYSLKQISEAHHLLYLNNKVYDIKVLSKKPPQISISINGYLLELILKDHLTQILEELGMDMSMEEQIDGVDAPMPGSILEVSVQEGEQVKKGDKLVILEAMKMENVIKSPVDGIIKSIHVNPGDNVEKNYRLLSF